jgi:arsenate reductase (glutaredoxin)
MSVKIYGLKSCDTVRKALGWLKAHDIDHEFHDYRAEGISAETVAGWCARAGWEKVFNKASATFRELPDGEREGLDEARAVTLMVRDPAMIKRPVLVLGDQVVNGFKPELYAGLFSEAE